MSLSDRRSRASAVLGSAIFLLLAPGTLGVLVPMWISGWRVHASFPGFGLMRAAGVMLMVLGAAILLECFWRFAMNFGTPAPIYPAQRLVVRGSYRFVRNPMFVAVTTGISGQAMLLGDWWLAVYALGFWSVAHCFVRAYEEKTLRSKFGEEYDRYRSQVPRWIPRMTPWME